MEIVRIILIISGAVGIALLILSLHLIRVALGYFGKGTGKTCGYIAEMEHSANVRVGSARRIFYKHYVKWSYRYGVDGKVYPIEGGAGGGTRRNIPNPVTVIYQKCNPKYAYVKGLRPPSQWITAPLTLIASVLFLLLAFLLWH